MMRTLYVGATTLFVVCTLGLWIASLWFAEPPAAASAGYTLREVAKHNRADDCWMAIGGQVYDFTAYLPTHPTAPQVIVPSCGTDATQAYATKNAGRPHSPFADSLMKKYLLGPLQR